MDHVEECPSYYVDCWGTICDCDYMHICMCRELRACEQRVRRSLWLECYDAAMQTTESNYVWHEKRGYAAALDAVQEAVAALPWKVAVSFGPIDCDESCEHGPCVCSGVMRPEAWMTGPAETIAAIDALRKDQP